jgi:hypothetical protein
LRKIGFPKTLLLRDLEKKPLFPMAIVVSPDFGSDHTIYVATRYQGIYRSVNAGRQWSQSLPVLHRRITALVISPDVKSDKTLYAGVAQEGIYNITSLWIKCINRLNQNGYGQRRVDLCTLCIRNSYKTNDGGETWQLIYQDHSDNILLAISPHYKDDGTVLRDTSEGLRKTSDRGKSWERIDWPFVGRYPSYESIALSTMENGTELIIVTLKGNGLFRVETDLP